MASCTAPADDISVWGWQRLQPAMKLSSFDSVLCALHLGMCSPSPFQPQPALASPSPDPLGKVCLLAPGSWAQARGWLGPDWLYRAPAWTLSAFLKSWAMPRVILPLPVLGWLLCFAAVAGTHGREGLAASGWCLWPSIHVLCPFPNLMLALEKSKALKKEKAPCVSLGNVLSSGAMLPCRFSVKLVQRKERSLV